MGAGGAPRTSQIEPTGRNLAEKAAGVAAGLVKGAGQLRGGSRGATGHNLDESVHGAEIFTKAHDTLTLGKAAAIAGWGDGDGVADSFSRDFTSNREFIARTGGLSRLKNDAQVRKAFTATNMGLSGVPYGLVPFDLLAPSRLIYPVYTLFRNKFPRPAGQGSSRQVYGLLGISGSQTGGQGVIDISIPELVKTSSNTINGSSANWPINLPQTGSQTEYKLNVPYRFFGLTESLSWLAQFEGQGQLRGPLAS
jgi:hypothetical protein